MLLASRLFAPLFVTQFLGAFNDNLYKNALVLLVLFHGLGQVEATGVVVNLAAGVFILPFFLLSASAGQWADAADKTSIARLSKWLELLIVVLGGWGLLAGDLVLSLLALGLLGAQSALFGPVKYGVLPQHLRPEELLAGNAWIEAATFLAILLGTLIAGVLVAGEGAERAVSALALVVAIGGLLAVHAMPAAPPAAAAAPVDRNLLRSTWSVLRWARGEPVWPLLLGISWFWAFGATVLTQLPMLVRDVLAGDAAVVSSLLAVFSVGVGAGSLLAAVVLRREPGLPLVAAAAADMAIFTGLLLWLAGGLPPGAAPRGLVEWWGDPHSLAVAATLFGLAVSGGAYCVPLYTALQRQAPEARRGQAVAANNIVNSLGMVLAAAVGAALLAAGLEVPRLLAVAGAIHVPVALWAWRVRLGTAAGGPVRPGSGQV